MLTPSLFSLGKRRERGTGRRGHDEEEITGEDGEKKLQLQTKENEKPLPPFSCSVLLLMGSKGDTKMKSEEISVKPEK